MCVCVYVNGHTGSMVGHWIVLAPPMSCDKVCCFEANLTPEPEPEPEPSAVAAVILYCDHFSRAGFVHVLNIQVQYRFQHENHSM